MGRSRTMNEQNEQSQMCPSLAPNIKSNVPISSSKYKSRMDTEQGSTN